MKRDILFLKTSLDSHKYYSSVLNVPLDIINENVKVIKNKRNHFQINPKFQSKKNAKKKKP